MNVVKIHPENTVKAFSLCLLAYLLALGAAAAVVFAAPEVHPVIRVLYADIAGTLVIFLFSRIFRNASFYDPYWSVAPPVIAFYWLLSGTSEGVPLRQVIVVALVLLWSVRLTYNWARQWRGLGHEDWRYSGLREKTGSRFWLVDLLGIEMMPTMMVFLGCLPLYAALAAGTRPFGIIDVLAVIVTAGAISLEAAADRQMGRFRREKQQKGRVMDRGLWAYSRHPNYLGEVLFWWGVFFFGLAAAPGYWWTTAGPVTITALFTFISIPMMEKRNLSRRPEYAVYARRVPALLPRFSFIPRRSEEPRR